MNVFLWRFYILLHLQIYSPGKGLRIIFYICQSTAGIFGYPFMLDWSLVQVGSIFNKCKFHILKSVYIDLGSALQWCHRMSWPWCWERQGWPPCLPGWGHHWREPENITNHIWFYGDFIRLKITLAERMTHMSHRFTLTARKSALLSGDPWRNEHEMLDMQIVKYCHIFCHVAQGRVLPLVLQKGPSEGL